MVRITQIIAFADSLATAALWTTLLFFNPYGGQGQTMQSNLTAGLMLLFTVVAAVTAVLKKPYLLLGITLISFIPIGFYTLGTPGLFRWIGVLNVLLLIDGFAMASAKRRASNPRPN